MTIAIVIIGCLVVLSIAGHAVFMRRSVDSQALESSGPAEAMLGVVGTLFSVLLGLLVAGAIDRYKDVVLGVENEANATANIFRLSKGLSEQDRLRIRSLCREYTGFVLHDEWQLMEQKKTSPDALDRYDKLWEAAVAVQPNGDRENNLHAEILDNMDELGENRRARVIGCVTSMPETLWAVILCGSAITIAFTYLFTVRMGMLHWMMTGLVAISLGLNIWLLAAYSTPFSGDLQIRPSGFELLENSILTANDDQARYLSPLEQPSIGKNIPSR